MTYDPRYDLSPGAGGHPQTDSAEREARRAEAMELLRMRGDEPPLDYDSDYESNVDIDNSSQSASPSSPGYSPTGLGLGGTSSEQEVPIDFSTLFVTQFRPSSPIRDQSETKGDSRNIQSTFVKADSPIHGLDYELALADALFQEQKHPDRGVGSLASEGKGDTKSAPPETKGRGTTPLADEGKYIPVVKKSVTTPDKPVETSMLMEVRYSGVTRVYLLKAGIITEAVMDYLVRMFNEAGDRNGLALLMVGTSDTPRTYGLTSHQNTIPFPSRSAAFLDTIIDDIMNGNTGADPKILQRVDELKIARLITDRGVYYVRFTLLHQDRFDTVADGKIKTLPQDTMTSNIFTNILDTLDTSYRGIGTTYRSYLNPSYTQFVHIPAICGYPSVILFYIRGEKRPKYMVTDKYTDTLSIVYDSLEAFLASKEGRLMTEEDIGPAEEARATGKGIYVAQYKSRDISEFIYDMGTIERNLMRDIYVMQPPAAAIHPSMIIRIPYSGEYFTYVLKSNTLSSGEYEALKDVLMAFNASGAEAITAVMTGGTRRNPDLGEPKPTYGWPGSGTSRNPFLDDIYTVYHKNKNSIFMNDIGQLNYGGPLKLFKLTPYDAQSVTISYIPTSTKTSGSQYDPGFIHMVKIRFETSYIPVIPQVGVIGGYKPSDYKFNNLLESTPLSIRGNYYSFIPARGGYPILLSVGREYVGTERTDVRGTDKNILYASIDTRKDHPDLQDLQHAIGNRTLVGPSLERVMDM